MFPYLIAGAIGYAVAKIFESDEAPKYADGGSVLLAPNGKPSNLTPEQYKLVRKPEFKAWFGDWENDPANASKVVDSNGEPMVLYHGTDVNFNVYDLSKIGEGSDLLGKGIYLTENKDVANFYANLVAKKRYIKGYEDGFFGSTNAIYEEDADEKAEKHKLIYEFFVNAKNIKNINQININNDLKQILIKSISFIFKDKSEDVINSRIDFADKNHNQIRNYRGKIIYLIEQFPDAKKEILEYIKNKYDCIFFEPTTEFESNLKDYKNYVIFKPNQIKLANGTNTTFDGNNPDIRYADGGQVNFNELIEGYEFLLEIETDKNKIKIYKEIIEGYELILELNNPSNEDSNSILLAPNGKPSNLTPEQYKLVRKPEFKAWFGDWINDPENSSKVIDKVTKEPLVVYHGSRSTVNFAFSEFNIPQEGVFFSSDYGTASWFSGGVDMKLHFEKIKKPLNLSEKSSLQDLEKYFKENFDNTANIKEIIYDDGTKFYRFEKYNDTSSAPLGNSVEKAQKELYKDILNEIDYTNSEKTRPFYQVFLNIRKPYVINGKGKPFYETPFEDGEYSAHSVTSEIKKREKNDGVIIYNTIEGTDEYYQKISDSYIAFNANQIKLADGSNTTFDGNNPDIRYAGGGDVDNKTLMKNDFLNEQNQLQRNSKYAILLDATWNNYTDEMRGIEDDLKNELIKKLGYNPLYNYFPFSDKDSKILMFDDDSNLLGLLIFTTEPKYTVVPRFSPSDIKPEKLFENNNNVFYLEYIFSFGKGNGQKMMNQIKKYADKYNVQIGLEGSVVEKSKGRYMASAKHLERFYDKQGFENVWGNYFIYIPNSKFAGGGDVKKVKFSIEEEEERTTISIKGIGEVILVETFPEYEFLEDVGEDGLEELEVEEGDMIGKIEHLEIDDKYKGKGYAKLLMNKAIEVAEEKGLMPLYLNASPMGSKQQGLNIQDLTGFYESFGFEVFLEQGNNNLMILK